MGQPAPLFGQAPSRVHRLVHDLPGLQVAPEGALAGRAKRTADRAADLRRDAERRAARVSHDDRFDRVPAVQLIEDLGRRAAIGGRLEHRVQRAQAEASRELRAQRGGEVVHVREAAGAAAEPTLDLRSPVARLAPLGEPGGQVGPGE